MLRKSLIALLLLSSVCIASDYHITDFIPDSLVSWKFAPSIRLSNSYNSYDREERIKIDTSEIDRDKDNSTIDFSINPGITIYLKIINQHRDLFMSNSLSYAYSRERNKGEYYRSSEYQTKTQIDLDQFRPRYTCNVRYNEYVWKSFGFFLNGNLMYTRTRQNQDEQSDVEDLQYNELAEIMNDMRRKYTDYSIDLNPGLSLGRVYNGMYAAKAEEIIKELSKVNGLKRDLSKTEFLELSKLILSTVESYHYDSRIKRIESLQKIIGFLRSIGVIDSSNDSALLSLTDTYVYSPFYKSRMFGKQLYFKFRFNENKKIDYSELTNEAYQYISTDSLVGYSKQMSSRDLSYLNNLRAIQCGFENHRILNWNFWYYMNISAEYQHGFIKNKRTYITEYIIPAGNEELNRRIEESRQKQLILSSNTKLFYQFTSRSIASLSVNASYSSLRTTAMDASYTPINTNPQDSFEFIIRPELDYYLTPRMVFNLNYIVNFYWYTLDSKYYDDTGENARKVINKNRYWRIDSYLSVDLTYYF